MESGATSLLPAMTCLVNSILQTLDKAEWDMFIRKRQDDTFSRLGRSYVPDCDNCAD